ncbi:hypothetical protein GCM10009839_00680 [Catenulispora yoronensis]|uniref:Uncharacterized protein n=1 Tax=Catenulispora yoronensis TaxID=450799 RepID=A0ABP5F1W8_9ACTN
MSAAPIEFGNDSGHDNRNGSHNDNRNDNRNDSRAAGRDVNVPCSVAPTTCELPDSTFKICP